MSCAAVCTTIKSSTSPQERRTPATRTATVHIVSAVRPDHIFVLPVGRVEHFGIRAETATPDVASNRDVPVCPHYDFGGDKHCPRGDACMYLHADLAAADVFTPHWLSRADAHERMPADAGVVALLPPNAAQLAKKRRGVRTVARGTRTVPATHLLATVGARDAVAAFLERKVPPEPAAPASPVDSDDAPCAASLRECLHFRKGVCHRGTNCQFAHVAGPPATPAATEASAAAAPYFQRSADPAPLPLPTTAPMPLTAQPSNPAPATLPPPRCTAAAAEFDGSISFSMVSERSGVRQNNPYARTFIVGAQRNPALNGQSILSTSAASPNPASLGASRRATPTAPAAPKVTLALTPTHMVIDASGAPTAAAGQLPAHRPRRGAWHSTAAVPSPSLSVAGSAADDSDDGELSTAPPMVLPRFACMPAVADAATVAPRDTTPSHARPHHARVHRPYSATPISALAASQSCAR